jgi:phosphatidate cytidylyltransferase
VTTILFSLAYPLWAPGGRAVTLILLTTLFAGALFLVGMMDKSLSFASLCGAFFAGVLPSLSLSCLVLIFGLPNGRLLVLMPFAVAWMCDGLAFFGGRLFGKHPLAPVLSPKKTIEGAISGLAGAVLTLIVFAIIFSRVTGATIDYPRLFLVGIAGGIISQFGDLSFSYIKRQYGVKDYGSILPGHGGILDRFDSLIFVAPLMLYFLTDFPFFQS